MLPVVAWPVGEPSIGCAEARFPNELEYFGALDRAQHGSRPIEETFNLLVDSTNALTLPRIEPQHMRFYGVLETPPSPIQVAPAPQERKVQPRNAMFNDAQIASIKARLRLDKNQEQHWVPVELALRRIVWRWASSSGPQLADEHPKLGRRLHWANR